jgi:RNA polymerase sigma factor for flagellar operon FliA
MADNGSPQNLLLVHLDLVERVVESICRRKGCGEEEAADFSSWVNLRLIEEDYAILRKFRGECDISTYLNAVVQNLFRDYRTSKWGKWRPSATAQRLGAVAVQLETLTSRDDYSFEEAMGILLSNLGSATSREILEGLAAQLPLRARRRAEPLERVEATSDVGSEERVERGELGAVQSRTERALAEAMRDLPGEDRLLLKLRFEDGFTVADIARSLSMAHRPLYSRFDRCLRRLREGLEGRGVRLEEVRELLAWRDLGVKVDYGWERLVEGPSNLAEESG